MKKPMKVEGYYLKVVNNNKTNEYYGSFTTLRHVGRYLTKNGFVPDSRSKPEGIGSICVGQRFCKKLKLNSKRNSKYIVVEVVYISAEVHQIKNLVCE